MVFENFDIHRVINLRDRTDRRRETIEELKRVRASVDTTDLFFDAIRPAESNKFSSIGERGVYESHLRLIEYAVDKNQSILILEDDVDFTDAVFSFSLDHDFDIFYGGYQAKTPNELHSSDIIGAHMMGFSAAVLPDLLNFITELYDDPSDPCPIDGAYVRFRRKFPQYSTCFAIPILAYQRPSRSDIASPKRIDNIPGLGSFVSAGRKLKRRLLKFKGN